MVRIPEYDASVVPDIGRTPQVHLDDSIAQGIGAAGLGIQQVAQVYRLRQEQQAKTLANFGLQKLNADMAAKDQQDWQNMPADGSGWHDTRVANFDAAAKTYEDTYVKALPADQQEAYRQQIAINRENYATDAAATQNKQRTTWAVGTAIDTQNKALSATIQNPDAGADQQQQYEKFVHDLPIRDDEKAKLLRNSRLAFGSAAATGYVQQGRDTDAYAAVGDATGGYYNSLRKAESGGNDSAAASTGSAAGRYGFTAGTWSDLARAHPDLGLTPEGRTDPRLVDQQERAVRALTADNSKALQASGIDPTGANLRMAHFLGAGGAIKFLHADPNAPAADLFPKEAAANPSIFYAGRHNDIKRTVAQVYGVQTRQFGRHSIADDSAPDIASSGFGAHQEAIDGVDSLIRQRDTATRQQDQAEKYTVGGLVTDDIASMRKTGQGVPNLDPGRVSAALGPDKANDWLKDRQTAQNYHSATADLPLVSNDEMGQRLVTLTPTPGSPNFAQEQKLHDDVQKEVDRVQTLREKDPAAAAQEVPAVKAAVSQASIDRPDSVLSAAKATLAAQATIGIPSYAQRVLTNQQARNLAAPIISAGQLTGRDDVSKPEKQALTDVVTTIQHLYGPYAEQVLGQVIEQTTKDRQLGPLAASVFRKLVAGQPLSAQDRQNVEAASDAANASQAVQGTKSTIDTGWYDPSSDWARESMQPPKPVMPTPSQRAMAALTTDPKLADQFDRKYGEGAAQSILGPAEALKEKPAAPPPVASDQAEVDAARAKLPQAKQNAIRAAADALKSGADPKEIENRLTAAGVEQSLWPIEWEYNR